MNTHQNVFIADAWQTPLETLTGANLVLLFGHQNHFNNPTLLAEIQAHYPNAELVGCTTSGELLGTDVFDKSLCLSAIEFEHTKVKVQSANIAGETVESVAKSLAKRLPHEGLRYVLVLSDGQKVNGTELVKGLHECLPQNILVTGGLAGDGTRFKETLVWHNQQASSGQILLVGFYGERLEVGHGCYGGWQPFGSSRAVTKSESNVLYELDGKPALTLYKKYLGDYANELPASALLFPLLMKDGKRKTIRTILNINESDGSMIFAGDIPQGASVQLMRANASDLIDGAEIAASRSLENLVSLSHRLQELPTQSGLALLISCVGRRLVLKDYTDEELAAAKDIIGDDWAFAGFYSYGELAPTQSSADCELHNQTLAITTLCEV